MIIVNNRPADGVDLSHWNADPQGILYQTWIEFFGHKAVHHGGKNMVDGVDPKFNTRRFLAQRLGFRWRAFYMWLVPASVFPLSAQVNLLMRTVGELKLGEAVYIDWEDVNVTKDMIEEVTTYMDLEFLGRWFMYVNDQTPDMVSWMEENRQSDKIAVMHPNYSLEQGLVEAKKWNATVWQTGLGAAPGFAGEVPLDYVLRPRKLDLVCGLSKELV